MPRQKKTWVYNPKPEKFAVPELAKKRLTKMAEEVLISHIKPEHIKRPPKKSKFNYIVDIYTKWYRNCFYFCSKYHCPDPAAISSEFESKFARLEYRGNGKYDLAYFRHTGKWWVTHKNISASDALNLIKEGGIYMP